MTLRIGAFERGFVVKVLPTVSPDEIERLFRDFAPLLRQDQIDAMRRALDNEQQRRSIVERR